MKIKIFAIALAFGIIIAVIINTIMLTGTIDDYSDRIENMEISNERPESTLALAKSIYSDFKRSETFMSLTVNHNDLTAIEELFAEMIGYLMNDDCDGAKVAKSRLADALSHLRRLSGVNIDSII